MQYKYQINIDGSVAAYRFPYLLIGDSVVLKQDSQYYEHFYNMLEPNKHYIPVRRDLSDLVEKLKWAIKNDNIAKNISLEGNKWARENLMPTDVFCYHVSLLNVSTNACIVHVEICKYLLYYKTLANTTTRL